MIVGNDCSWRHGVARLDVKGHDCLESVGRKVPFEQNWIPVPSKSGQMN